MYTFIQTLSVILLIWCRKSDSHPLMLASPGICAYSGGVSQYTKDLKKSSAANVPVTSVKEIGYLRSDTMVMTLIDTFSLKHLQL